MTATNAIFVSTHVGRDLLQSANIFKTADVAVWEYIVNSLQYVSHGISPSVVVDVDNRKKRITISDNGQGMDETRLNHFFTMHGENIERKQGVGGRGKYGTGKSAAFGIGKKIIVDTVCNGLRNRVELSKEDIERSDGSDIPVKRTVANETTSDDSGTTVHIEGIFLQKIDASKIIKKVERHLQSYRSVNPQVLIGDHLCTYKEPLVQEEHRFEPDEVWKQLLGDVELVVRVAMSPLESDERGVSVHCGPGNLVAVEDSGVCSKDMGEYIFGEIDVPRLESVEYEMDAFNASRDMKLRPEHPVAIALIAFIGTKLELIRKQLVKKKREASQEQANQELKQQADKIADLLNADFKAVNEKLLKIRSTRRTSGNMQSDFGGETGTHEESDGWVKGIEERGDLPESDIKPREEPNPFPPLVVPPDEPPISGEQNEEGESSVDPISEGGTSKKRRPRGGFSVEYEHMGEDEDRAKYIADRGLFMINLDHPVVKSANNALGISDIGFIRLSHEIVFTEYALALANMAAVDDPDIPADDVIYDARETLNRISAKSAILYQ